MFKRVKDYVQNKGLCFTMRSKSKKVTISICNDLNAVRIVTPYTDNLVDGLGELLPALSNAYKDAQDNNDEVVADELHGIRHTISKAYG